MSQTQASTWKSTAGVVVAVANTIGLLCVFLLPLGFEWRLPGVNTAVYATEDGEMMVRLLFQLVTPIICALCVRSQSDHIKPAPMLGGLIAFCSGLLLWLMVSCFQHVADSQGAILGMNPSHGPTFLVLCAVGIISLGGSLFIGLPLQKTR